MVLTLLTLACALRLDPVDPGDKPEDGGGTDETGEPDDSGPVDTSPPLPCDVPEVEPNNPISAAQDLPMEKWACGTFSTGDIVEVFKFDNEEGGWLRVWGRAFEIGSVADILLSVASDDGLYGASRLSNPDSTDADMVFFVDRDYTFYATLAEQYGRSGDAYRWEMMASMVKEPVEFDSTEAADNNSASTAGTVTFGDRVFGRIDSTTDVDWFAFDLPEGRTDLLIDVDAWYFGSPADTRIELFKPDGESFRESGSRADSPEGYDLDPYLSASVTEGGRWTVKIFPEPKSETGAGGGGRAYWYVLKIQEQ